MITAQQIKELREKSGAGIADVKKALEESKGDADKAFAWLERKLGTAAVKKAGRETNAGLIDAYIHSNARVGVLLEIFCETDFVARNPLFKELAHDIALHIAAMSPSYLSLDTVPEDIRVAERARISEEVKNLDKPATVIEQIVEGKLTSYFGDRALLEQPFVKDQNKTVREYLAEAIGRFGENIKIGRFTRFEL